MSKRVLFFLICAVALVGMGCDLLQRPAASISGIVHPKVAAPNASPLYGVVVLDNDGNYDMNDPSTYIAAYYFTITGSELQSGQGVPYVFTDVPAGSYMVYAMINMSGGQTYVIDGNGTCQWGFYGDNYGSTTFVPTSANATVGKEGYLTCDFWVDTWVS